jgi:hypothetical protein
MLQELMNFRVKVAASANETFEAWRERDHDDLVLAVANAAWVGERVTQRLHVWASSSVLCLLASSIGEVG